MKPRARGARLSSTAALKALAAVRTLVQRVNVRMLADGRIESMPVRRAVRLIEGRFAWPVDRADALAVLKEIEARRQDELARLEAVGALVTASSPDIESVSIGWPRLEWISFARRR